MKRPEASLNDLASKIESFEQQYLITSRSEMEKFPDLAGQFPPYLEGRFSITCAFGSDGVVVKKLVAPEDQFHAFDVPNATIRELSGLTDWHWAEIQRDVRSQFPRFMDPGRDFAVQVRLAGIETTDNNSPGFGPDGMPPVSIYITSDYGDSHWSVPLAQAEASSDVNTFVAARFMAGPDAVRGKSAKEVTDTAVQHLTRVAEEFRQILDTATDERALQLFLQENPICFALDLSRVEPQFRLGAEFIADFLLERADQQYVFIEIEAAHHPLFTSSSTHKRRQQSAQLSHALQQVEDWQWWVRRNRSYLEERLPGVDEPEMWLVIGRTPIERHLRRAWIQKQLNARPIVLLTFDDLYDRIIRELRNLAK